MKFSFYKYQGTGNDFIMIDNRDLFFDKKNSTLINLLCDRRFGVGADGLILLENNEKVDFTMHYFNADGKLGSMCGNGGRCIVHFANFLGIISHKTIFQAVDGLHQAMINKNIISLKMNDVDKISKSETSVFLDTGSPHHVTMVNDLEELNVDKEGSFIRNKVYGDVGANINFVEKIDNTTCNVRTYERGVEAETLSCGTGVTAVALAMFETNQIQSNNITLKTKGGLLKVTFKKKNKIYEDIWLEGTAIQVFKGLWS